MSLFDFIPGDWHEFLELDKFPELEHTLETINKLYDVKNNNILPERSQVFRALDCCPVEDVRIIILGQDPYFVKGQANGLAFSCECKDRPLQPSLRNIFNEVERSLNGQLEDPRLQAGDLEPWAEQGVLLLNSVLTVEAGKARSHTGLGWEKFTMHILNKLLTKKKNLVFMRWGKDAEAIRLPPMAFMNHLILTASHPSPYSCHISFAGCDHFVDCNKYLVKHGYKAISWLGCTTTTTTHKKQKVE